LRQESLQPIREDLKAARKLQAMSIEQRHRYRCSAMIWQHLHKVASVEVAFHIVSRNLDETQAREAQAIWGQNKSCSKSYAAIINQRQLLLI